MFRVSYSNDLVMVQTHAFFEGHEACADMMIPTMTPNSPSALPKISITKILTNSVEFCASDKAQLLPIIPTHNLCQRSQEKQQDKTCYQNEADIALCSRSPETYRKTKKLTHRQDLQSPQLFLKQRWSSLL